MNAARNGDSKKLADLLTYFEHFARIVKLFVTHKSNV